MVLREFSLEEQMDNEDRLVHGAGGTGVYRLLWKLLLNCRGGRSQRGCPVGCLLMVEAGRT